MKKSKKLIMILGLTIIVFFATVVIFYFSSTMSVDACKKYCCENTMRNATDFERIGDGRYVEDYAYWIASNGDSSKGQEIFVFRKKKMGPFSLDRYNFIASSTQSNYHEDATEVGSIQFFTRNDKGEKETGATLIFFGAKADSDIVKYEYKLTVSEGSIFIKAM